MQSQKNNAPHSLSSADSKEAELAEFLHSIAPLDDAFFFQGVPGAGGKPRPFADTIPASQLQTIARKYSFAGGTPCISINRLKGSRRCKENVVGVRALFVDLDLGGPDGAVQLERAQYWLTPTCIVESSEGRYHVYWAVEDGDTDQALQVFEPAQRALAKMFNGDPACCDLARVMRLPGFPNYKRGGVVSRLIGCFGVSYPLADIIERIEDAEGPLEVGKTEEVKDIDEREDLVCLGGSFAEANEADAIKAIVSWPAAVEGAQGNQTTYNLACKVRDYGVPKDKALTLLSEHYNPRCSPPWSEKELNDLIEHAYLYANGPLGSQSAEALANKLKANDSQDMEEVKAAISAKSWEDDLIIHQVGRGDRAVDVIVHCLPNCLTLLRRWAEVEHTYIYYDVLKDKIFAGERELDDSVLNSLKIRFNSWALKENWTRKDYSRENFHDALMQLANDTVVDPIRSWLDSLTWDGQDRLTTWGMRVLGAQTELEAKCCELAMIGAVARALRPGCKVDNVLVLVGGQGVKKSSLVRAMFGEEWFSDSFNSDVRTKDTILQIQGYWAVELAELDRVIKEESHFKDFCSRQEDVYRPPYGKHLTSRPRRCVFWGTTNEPNFLLDYTGNRRFWPVVCHKGGEAMIKGIQGEREQLFAQAVDCYRKGAKWWLDPSQESLLSLAHDQHFDEDPWECSLREALKDTSRISTTDLWDMLDIPMAKRGRREGGRLKRIMTRLGFQYGSIRDGVGIGTMTVVKKGYKRVGLSEIED